MASVVAAAAATAVSEAVPALSSQVKIALRKSIDRGHANHGWLNTYHTFSFAGYQDDKYDHFHSLRVINEDRVLASEGFGTHGHRNFEIFSYVVNGELTHRDSMGNVEKITRGWVQSTSAGRGIQHSEFNEHDTDLVHFLQIWVTPSKQNIQPKYYLKQFTDEQKRGKLCLIVSPDGADKSVTIQQDVRMYATILDSEESVSLTIAPGRNAYLHLIQDVTGYKTEAKRVKVSINNNQVLESGDGAFVVNQDPSLPMQVTLKGVAKSGVLNEVLFFDINASQ